jgi:hypothetical protein
MKEEKYNLIVPFPDQSESFTLGFEAGIIWNRLTSGEVEFNLTVHTSNLPVLRNMAKYHGLLLYDLSTNVDGWIQVEFRKSRNKLSLVSINEEYNT